MTWFVKQNPEIPAKTWGRSRKTTIEIIISKQSPSHGILDNHNAKPPWMLIASAENANQLHMTLEITPRSAMTGSMADSDIHTPPKSGELSNVIPPIQEMMVTSFLCGPLRKAMDSSDRADRPSRRRATNNYDSVETTTAVA